MSTGVPYFGDRVTYALQGSERGKESQELTYWLTYSSNEVEGGEDMIDTPIIVDYCPLPHPYPVNLRQETILNEHLSWRVQPNSSVVFGGTDIIEGLPTSRLSFETFQVEGSVQTNV